MPAELHESAEDYLKAILVIQNKKGYVRSIDVANQMNVSKPSVSYATKHLRERGYITFNEDGMILLTEAGDAVARKIFNRHQILTRFFVKLGVNEGQAEIDAHKIEHDISEETFLALQKHAENL